ncbi:MAG TPA: 2TM domain-containing protein [Saprospiraceae bacterium]|nr:2TM domain-containing protein [Saprospiraceae bacterium]HMQ84507.1 2TM domain-containing protein [Saprospiraceae bacterium]
MYDQQYLEARKKVQEKKKFYTHLGTYVVMGAFFFILNMLTSPFNWWFYWPMLGWGIGLAMHYIRVFGLPGTEVMTEDWEEKEIQRELRKKRPAQGRLPEGKHASSDAGDSDYLELKELEKKEKPAWDDKDLV